MAKRKGEGLAMTVIRLRKLDKMLATGWNTVSDLARELGVTKRMVRRYIEVLLELGQGAQYTWDEDMTTGRRLVGYWGYASGEQRLFTD
jgi:hypothetical protein